MFKSLVTLSAAALLLFSSCASDELLMQRVAPNTLSEAEVKAGWELLFDGETGEGWRGFRSAEFPDGWQVQQDSLVRASGGGDLITERQFANFELRLDWKIVEGGNSGIFYRVDEEHGAVWETGAEMQVLDDAHHADGKNALTSAGANYALHAPQIASVLPAGEWNVVRLVVNGDKIEHWLNGVRVVSFTLWDAEWEKLVAASKFASMPDYARNKTGHIALQDHGDIVWYRNIKIREL